MRLIDADKLKAEFDLIASKSAKGEWFSIPIKHIMHDIDNAPTVKPQRPKGKWLKSGKGKTTFFCSECGREIDTKPFTRPDNFPFCHCGADMRGEEE